MGVCVYVGKIDGDENHCPRQMTGKEKWTSPGGWLRPIMGHLPRLCTLRKVLFQGRSGHGFGSHSPRCFSVAEKNVLIGSPRGESRGRFSLFLHPRKRSWGRSQEWELQ